MFFFFQAEDGIRDYKVTGVQTCALPIYREPGRQARDLKPERHGRVPAAPRQRAPPPAALRYHLPEPQGDRGLAPEREIGRGSGRERGEISVGAVSLKKKKKDHHHVALTQ